MSDSENGNGGFWDSIPKILKSIAVVIGAITSLYLAITQFNKSAPTPEPPPESTLTTVAEPTPTPVPTPPPVPPVPQYSVSGLWEYTAQSQVNTDNKCVNRLRLTMDGSIVTGVFTTCDHTGSGVEGTFHNDTLEFSRQTGLDNTVQAFRLTKMNDDKFTGKFWNIGVHQDIGTITIQRQD